VDSADYNPYWLLYLGAIVLAGRYWKNAQDHGLETPNLALFQQFKKDTSEAIAAQSKKRKP
jgi:hypothetical protein